MARPNTLRGNIATRRRSLEQGVALRVLFLGGCIKAAVRYAGQGVGKGWEGSRRVVRTAQLYAIVAGSVNTDVRYCQGFGSTSSRYKLHKAQSSLE